MLTLVILPIVSCFFLIGFGYFIFRAWKEKTRVGDEITRTRGNIMLVRNISIALLLLSTGNLLDTAVPFPFPFVGSVSVYFSLLTGLIGGVMLYFYAKPKIQEALMLAERTGGYLTLIVMMRKLGLSERMVRKTMQEMLRLEMITVLNPSKKKLPEIVFLVKNFSGKTPQSESPSENADEKIREQFQSGGVDIHVDDVNNMLLGGSLNLGQSGRPERRDPL
jgi:hypothetical protein